MENGQLKEGIKRRIGMAELYRDLLLSNITEAMKICLNGVLTMIESHNAQVPFGKFASKQSVIGTFQATSECIEGKFNDAFADLIVDLERAVEEYDNENEISHRTRV